MHFLAEELKETLSSARIEKAYQPGKKELKLKLYGPEKGSMELILTPAYLSVTSFPRKVPEMPSSFAMQLRKNIRNGFVRDVKQHEFDRILEIVIEKGDKRFLLIAEFFSRGNVIFCDESRKILGLFEWQKWKDRKLGVGQTYEYPPQTQNPLRIDYTALKGILASSQKKLVSTLATDAGLGGLYAEEVCLISGTDKDAVSGGLDARDMESVYSSFNEMIGKIREGKSSPSIIIREGKPIDVIPFDLSIYDGFEKKEFTSLNEAIDEYFSREEAVSAKKEAEKIHEGKLGKLKEIESRQEEVIERFGKESVESQKTGDIIYQNLHAVEEILQEVKKEKSRGASWSDIRDKLAGKKAGTLRIEDVKEDGRIILETVE